MPSDTFYSGQIGYARVALGKDAYKKNNNFDDDDSDPHGFKIGVNKLVGKPDEKKPTSALLGDNLKDSAHNNPNPVHTVETPK